MHLHYSPGSPFVRKVLVVAHEAGLAAQIATTARAVSPVAVESAVAADNPLAKIPCLVTDAGEALYDSRVICEYLDSQHSGHKLFPHDGPARWLALRRQALADGICEAAILSRYEAFVRPADRRWEDWITGQMGKVGRGLDQLEAEAASFPVLPDIGQIAVAVTLGYLDYRFADDRWRATRPQLARWHAAFAARPSMQATLPPDA